MGGWSDKKTKLQATPTHKQPPSTSNPSTFGQAETLSPMVPDFTYFWKGFRGHKKCENRESNTGFPGHRLVFYSLSHSGSDITSNTNYKQSPSTSKPWGKKIRRPSTNNGLFMSGGFTVNPWKKICPEKYRYKMLHTMLSAECFDFNERIALSHHPLVFRFPSP